MTVHTKKNGFLTIALICCAFLSCRTEDDLSIDPPAGSNIEADSQIASLMRNISLNDGSYDDILDSANCLEILLPVRVDLDGDTYIINEQGDYATIESVMEESNLDEDDALIAFPITVILPDFSTIEVNSDEALKDLADNCLGASEEDDDIECIDFDYPITASAFDLTNELIITITINSDVELYAFVENLSDFSAVTLNFPITVVVDDIVFQDVNNISELSESIIASNESCDEEDDSDAAETCDDCTESELVSLLTGCESWEVFKLRVDGDNAEDDYEDFEWSFFNNGTILIDTDNGEVSGTYTVTDNGSAVFFSLFIAEYPIFNKEWILYKLKDKDNNKPEVEFKLNKDKLKFKGDCDD